jgi:hypothetical protein
MDGAGWLSVHADDQVTPERNAVLTVIMEKALANDARAAAELESMQPELEAADAAEKAAFTEATQAFWQAIKVQPRQTYAAVLQQVERAVPAQFDDDVWVFQCESIAHPFSDEDATWWAEVAGQDVSAAGNAAMRRFLDRQLAEY